MAPEPPLVDVPQSVPPGAFESVRLGPVTLRNRVIKAATFEGMCPDGVPSEALIEHHRGIARGGAGLTTVAYCSVSPQGRSYSTQMWMREAIEEELRALTAAVHSEGGAASIQLGHCGGFSDRAVIGGRPLAPSRVFNTYGLSFSRSMTQADLDQVASDFVNAAQRAVAVGFDAVELHLGHGYLLSQFLSPHTNRRRDRYGGALENRLRFPLRVVSEVVKRLEGQAAVLVKMNLTDGFSGGLDVSEACEVARRLEERGVDALVLSGGFVSKTPLFMLRGEVPLAEMVAVQGPMWRKLGLWAFGRLFVQKYPYTDLFFLQEAVQVREAVAMPLVLLGGVRSSAHVEQAMEQGFDFVGMGRALLHNPALVNEMAVASGVIQSGCVPCNLCIVEMDRGGVRCVRSH